MVLAKEAVMDPEHIDIRLTQDSFGQFRYVVEYYLKEMPPWVVEQVLRDLADSWCQNIEVEDYMYVRRN